MSSPLRPSRLIYAVTDPIVHPSLCVHLSTLRGVEWADPGVVRDQQAALLRSLIAHAYATVPYYRRVMQERDLKPADITPETLALLPVLERETFRLEYPDGVTSAGLRGPRVGRVTSGTTGLPLRTCGDPATHGFDLATMVWLGSWAGYLRGDKVVNIALKLNHKLPNPLWHSLVGPWYLPPELVLQGDGTAIARRLNHWRPDVIHGRPLMLSKACAALVAGQEKLIRRPKAVIFTGDMVNDGTLRLVSDTFGCQVVSRYGAIEFGASIAQTCPASAANGDQPNETLHVNALGFIIEVVDEQGQPIPPGTEGRLVITDLRNRYMPRIRYAIGDRGTISLEPCRCGRGLPVLKALSGRVMDVLVLPSGRTLPDYYIYWPVHQELSHFWEHQFAQPEPDRLILSVVPNHQHRPENVLAVMADKLRAALPEPMHVEVEFVDELPFETSGKRPRLLTLTHHAKTHSSDRPRPTG